MIEEGSRVRGLMYGYEGKVGRNLNCGWMGCMYAANVVVQHEAGTVHQFMIPHLCCVTCMVGWFGTG